MKTASKFLPVLLGIISTVNTPVFGDAKVEEQEVGPASQNPQDIRYVVSPQGGHLAAVARKGSRMVVIIDGVAGPKFDEIITPTVPWVDPRGPEAEARAAGTVSANLHPIVPVTFSKDGKRFAYVGRVGKELVLMADNKEVLRIPIEGGGDMRIEFTGADGKHLLFARSFSYGYELYVDGQKWPGYFGSGAGGSEGTIDPLISPDSEHIAYVAQIDRDKRTLILDGKDAGYIGDHLLFTGDSKHLVCISRSPKGQSVLVDGKSLFNAKEIIDMCVAPAGNRIITVLTHFSKDGNNREGVFLLVDGKPVEASLGEQVKQIVFSPDGKRYAAVCGKAGAQFVVMDGKKGQEYFAIDTDLPGLSSGLRFSADSTKVGYTANASNKKFVVINDDESDAFDTVANFKFSPDGKRTVYAGLRHIPSPQSPGGYIQGWPVVIDGKTEKLDRAISLDSFEFSPDNSRYAYGGTVKQPGAIYLDGKDTGIVGNFTYSPDSKHFAVVGYRASDNKRGLFVDGKFVYEAENNYGVRYRAFTPDSQHLYWIAMEAAKGANAAPGAYEWVTYVDGKPVARCDSSMVCDQIHGSMYIQFQKTPAAWNVGSDGVLTFLGPVGDVVKQFKATPSSDTSIATMLANAVK